MSWAATAGRQLKISEDRRAEGPRGRTTHPDRAAGGTEASAGAVAHDRGGVAARNQTRRSARRGVGTNVGIDPGASDPGAPPGAFSASPEEEELVQFVSFVLDDLQGTWSELLPGYTKAHLVLFRGRDALRVRNRPERDGPVLLPGRSEVYIDLSFYRELRSRFGAPATSPRRT
jgi:predicted metalloprotease